MADNHSYEESISKVYYGLKLLAIVTLIEVFVSLFGKGHIQDFGYNGIITYSIINMGSNRILPRR